MFVYLYVYIYIYIQGVHWQLWKHNVLYLWKYYTYIYERYTSSLNKNQIITAVNDILPRAQACTNLMEGHLSTN